MHTFVIFVIFLNFLCVQLFVIISDSIERLVKERSNSSSVSLDAQTLIMKTEYQARLWHFSILLCMVQNSLCFSLSLLACSHKHAHSLFTLWNSMSLCHFSYGSMMLLWSTPDFWQAFLTGHWPSLFLSFPALRSESCHLFKTYLHKGYHTAFTMCPCRQ